MSILRIAVRLARLVTWPVRFSRSGYWMRLWLASTEQQAKLCDRVVELTAEADFNARAVLRLKAEAERLAEELQLSQAFARDGYAQFRRAKEELDGLRKRFPTGAGSGT